MRTNKQKGWMQMVEKIRVSLFPRTRFEGADAGNEGAGADAAAQAAAKAAADAQAKAAADAKAASDKAASDKAAADKAAAEAAKGDTDFLKSLPEEMRSDPSLLKHKDVISLAKSYLEIQKLMGKRMGLKDGKFDGDEDARKELVERLGVGAPKEAKEYTVDKDTLQKYLPEGMNINEEELADFKEHMHKSGATDASFKAALDWYYKTAGAQLKDQNAQAQKFAEDADVALRTEWGKSYTERMAISERVVEKLGMSKEDSEVVVEAMKLNPSLRRAFATIGEKVSEDRMGNIGKRYVMTPVEAKTEKDNLWKNHSAALTDKNHPEHATIKARYAELQAIEFSNTSSEGLKVA